MNGVPLFSDKALLEAARSASSISDAARRAGCSTALMYSREKRCPELHDVLESLRARSGTSERAQRRRRQQARERVEGAGRLVLEPDAARDLLAVAIAALEDVARNGADGPRVRASEAISRIVTTFIEPPQPPEPEPAAPAKPPPTQEQIETWLAKLG